MKQVFRIKLILVRGLSIRKDRKEYKFLKPKQIAKKIRVYKIEVKKILNFALDK